MTFRALLAGTAAALAISGSAQAADTFIPYEAPAQEEIASRFDVAFGVTLTSRYMSRGVAYTDGPALQGYVEASYDWAYIGVWASNVSGPNVEAGDSVEIDLYGGIRPTFGDLSLDLGYAHYFFDETGSCCGELYAKASYAFTPEFSAGTEFYWDPRFETHYVAVNAELALPHDFAISGAIGHNFEDKTDWNAGISWTWNDTVTLDARYHDANTQPARFVASVSFDTSLSALRALSR